MRARRSAAATRAARHGVRCRAGLEAADGDHLVPQPNSDGEGAGGRGAGPCRGRHRVAEGVEPSCPDEPRRGGRRAVQLAARWQVSARIVPRQRRSRNMHGLGQFFDNGVN